MSHFCKQETKEKEETCAFRKHRVSPDDIDSKEQKSMIFEDHRSKVLSEDEPISINPNKSSSLMGYNDFEKIPPYNLIGRLKFKWSDKKTYVGTASVLHCQTNTKRVYLLTAGHNVIDIDKTINKKVGKAVSMQFERRINTKDASKKLKSYKVHYWRHYPLYETNYCLGNDIAICMIYDEDEYFSNIWKSHHEKWPKYKYKYGHETLPMQRIVPWSKEKGMSLNIFGFPGEKKGELWGMAQRRIEIGKKSDAECIFYQTMDTSGGQSGSPVLQVAMGDQWHVVGVHVAWKYDRQDKQGYNVAARLTKEKIIWLAKEMKLNMICIKDPRFGEIYTIQTWNHSFVDQRYTILFAQRPDGTCLFKNKIVLII